MISRTKSVFFKSENKIKQCLRKIAPPIPPTMYFHLSSGGDAVVVVLPVVDETAVFGFPEFVFIVIVDKSVFISIVLWVVVVVGWVVVVVVNSVYQNKSIFEYYRKKFNYFKKEISKSLENVNSFYP